LCLRVGMEWLGEVSLDGAKIKANASKHKAMSYQRMGEEEKRLQGEVQALLKRASLSDAQPAEALPLHGRRGPDGAPVSRGGGRRIEGRAESGRPKKRDKVAQEGGPEGSARGDPAAGRARSPRLRRSVGGPRPTDS
jgi:hypothetical protein